VKTKQQKTLNYSFWDAFSLETVDTFEIFSEQLGNPCDVLTGSACHTWVHTGRLCFRHLLSRPATP
jgi:hypothetical protein